MLTIHEFRPANDLGRTEGYLGEDGATYTRPVHPVATITGGYTAESFVEDAKQALDEWAGGTPWSIDDETGMIAAEGKDTLARFIHSTRGVIDARDYAHLLVEPEPVAPEFDATTLPDFDATTIPDYDDLSGDDAATTLAVEIANVVKERASALLNDLAADVPSTVSEARERFEKHGLL